jgi:hypothetical protein
LYPYFDSHASHPLAWSLGFGANHKNEYKTNFLIYHPDLHSFVQNELTNSLKKDKNIILSSDVFSHFRNTEMLEKLKGIFKNCDIRIIIYVRRQDNYLESLFSNHVLRSYNARIKDFNIEVKSADRWPYWDKIIGTWAGVFGKENIIVRPFEKEQFVGGSIYTDFLSILKIGNIKDYDTSVGVVNRSFKPEITEIIRRFNRLALLKNERKKKIISIITRYLRSKKNDEIYKCKKDHILSPKERINILREFENSNKKVAITYLNRKDEKLFYENWPDINEEWQPVTVTLSNIFMFYAHFLLYLVGESKRYFLARIKSFSHFLD